jgi:predicted aspartyl protease
MAQGSGSGRRRSERTSLTGVDKGRRGFSGRLNPTAWVRATSCNSVYIMRYRSMRVPVSIRAHYNMADIKALVDSGATDNFMNPAFAKRMGIGLRTLDKPKNIFNIDDSTNRAGQITHYTTLAVTTAGTTKELRFLITDIGREDVLLGYPLASDIRTTVQLETCDHRREKLTNHTPHHQPK